VAQGKSGERYIVGGRYLSMADILNTLERVSGVPAPKRSIPYFVTLVYAWFLQTMAQITHRSTLITLESIRTSHLKGRVSSAKAMRELACTFCPFEETLRDEIAWYRAHPH
jgi:dihydroflavonol-4-reductase